MARPHPAHIITDDSALGGSLIEKSLRFNGQNETTAPQLRRTGTTTSSSFSIAMWAKLSRVSDQYKMFFSIGQENDANAAWVAVQDGQNMGFQGGNGTYTTITRVFRDPTSWFHFLISVNSNNFTVYIDGTSVQTGTMRSLDTSTNGIRIGANYGSYYPWNGYLADVYLIDGQAKAPTDFGYTESQTGIWRPKKYTGTFGTGGAHLEFKDSSSVAALGKDTSGNGNDFTPTTDGFNVTTGVGNDSVTDTPTNNFCALNPLSLTATGANISNGNLDYKSDSNYSIADGNFSLKTGKWYWEVTITAALSGGNGQINGIVRGEHPNSNAYVSYDTNGNVYGIGYVYNGSIQGTSPDGSTNAGSGGSGLATYTEDDVLGFASDIANGTLALYKNGSLQHTITGLNSYDWFPAGSGYGTSSTNTFNFGQLKTTSTTYADANGHGTFKYSVPSGFLAMCSANLPPNNPSIVRPQRHFDTILYTGNGSTQSITGLEFAPDFVWIKERSSTSSHGLGDTVRGALKVLQSDLTQAEVTTSTNFTSFDSNGFTHGSGGRVNENSQTYVAWCWKAGGTAVTNTVGNISAQVSANDEAGFSIITYTGDGNTSGNVGTGLRSTQPLDWAIVKRRDSTSDWQVGHRASGQSSNFAYHLNLNEMDALSGSAPYHMGTQSYTNGDRLYLAEGGLTSSATYVAYVWQERPGYSKFGSYTGNGSTNGTYVHLGFKPAFIITKQTNSTGSWFIFDNKRNGYNETEPYVMSNVSNTEATDLGWDFLSNGFKHRNSYGATNGSGNTFVYMAFAERPGTTRFDTFASAR